MTDKVATQANAGRVSVTIEGESRKSRRIFVVRGDLTSATGYGQATRSLALLLRQKFEIYGVDLHPEPDAIRAMFPGQLIQDSGIEIFCNMLDFQVVVLNYTTPENFQYFFGAINIGSFYWETSALPYMLQWREIIAGMDYMWAPSKYNAGLIKAAGYTAPISIVTWPHVFDNMNQADLKDSTDIYLRFIDMFQGEIGSEIDLGQLREKAESLFLSVKSLAPRKGLPILLTEWRDYISTSSTSDVLLLKLRFVHNSELEGEADRDRFVVGMIREAGWRVGDAARIAYTIEDLTEDQMTKLYRAADCYVTASYGEGFGGPVVEALLLQKPVIAGLHTGMADLLPPAYPLAFGSDPLHVELRGNSPIYPHASTWEIPRRGQLKAALNRFSNMSTKERNALILLGRKHAEAFCSVNAVKTQLEAFFDRVGL